MIFETERYKFDVTELQNGGPGGYESKYLTSEGHAVGDGLYAIFKNFSGDFSAASNRALRHRNGESLENVLKDDQKTGIASGFKPSGLAYRECCN